MDHLCIVSTGGTIDKIYFDDKSSFQVGAPQIGEILQAIGVAFTFDVIAIIRKDSLHITGEDRALVRRTIEAQPEAQLEWIEHATSLVAPTVLTHPTCNSWYNGANVPGKKRMYMGFTAGIPEYRRRCDEIADNGYAGFALA